MQKLLVLVNNMSSAMAADMSATVEEWLRNDRQALVLPSGLDPSVPVSIEVIWLEVGMTGAIRDAVRLGVPCEWQ